MKFEPIRMEVAVTHEHRVRLSVAVVPMALLMLLAWLLFGCAAPVVMGRPVNAQPAAALKLEILCADGGTPRPWTGSAVLVSPTVAFTAWHVVRCLDGAILATDDDGERVEVSVSAAIMAADLARLDVTAGGVRPVPLGAVPRPGQTVCIVALNPEPVRSCGVVVKVRRDGFISHTAPTVLGNSGAGVYDVRGRLVGVVTHRKIEPEVGGLFRPVTEAP